MTTKAKTIIVRASVNLPGLHAGETATVDPGDPHIAALLRKELLVDKAAPAEPIEGPAPDAGSPDKPQELSGDREPAAAPPRRIRTGRASEGGTDT